MIEAMVIVSAIAILLAVRFIVFLIETNAVPERKTVVRRQQVDRRRRSFAIALKRSLDPAKRPANSPATDSVPARSGARHRDSDRSTRQTGAGNSRPDSPFTDVPRLGNELHL